MAASPWGRHQLLVKLEPGPQCPACGMLLNGAMNLDLSGSPPGPGDDSVCEYCGAVLTFVTDPLRGPPALALSLTRGDDLTLALADPRIRRMRAAVFSTAIRLPDQSKTRKEKTGGDQRDRTRTLGTGRGLSRQSRR